jgi:hypothetical protein
VIFGDPPTWGWLTCCKVGMRLRRPRVLYFKKKIQLIFQLIFQFLFHFLFQLFQLFKTVEVAIFNGVMKLLTNLDEMFGNMNEILFIHQMCVHLFKM